MAQKPTYQELKTRISHLTCEYSKLVGLEDQSRLALRRSRLSSEYAKTLVREKNELVLSTKICQLIVERGGYFCAWLAFAEADKDKNIRAIAQTGLEDGYLDSVKMSWSEAAFRDHATSMAIRTGTSQSWSILDAEPSALPWQKEAERNGYEASLALPLMIDHQAFAALTICASNAGAFCREDILFWEACAEDLAFAIQCLRHEVRQRQTEQGLRKNEKRDALAQQAAKTGTWEWDIRTGSLDWSKQTYPLFGLRPDDSEITYEAFLKCIPSEDRPHVEASVNAAVYEGKAYDIEHPVQCPDGTLRWMSERGDVIRDKDGNPIRMVGVVQDITERKQSLEQTKTLSGIMPICSNCKQIRDAQGKWHQIETYIRDHSSAKFSHSICPGCAKNLYPDYDLKM